MQMDFAPDLVLFWLKKLTALALLPPLGPLLLIGLGLLLARRHRRSGFSLAWLGLATALALITPACVGWLLRGLETAPVISRDALAQGQAIVIPGAGKRRHAPEYGGETVNRLALERLRYGARLARRSGLPVLVSGGAPTGDAPEAELMRQALEEDFGVSVKWVERASRDTRENAQFSAVLLKGAGVKTIVLVTHAAHMPRAQAAFEAEGLRVIPAPTAWFGGTDVNEGVLSMLPGASSAFAGWIAAHEWLGGLAYRLSR